MKKMLLFCLLIAASIGTKAQTTVTIPDAHFVTWLTANIPSAMSGNQMDTSNVAVTSLTSMTISNDSIADITGVEYFPSLQLIDCSANQIVSINAFPASLQNLICSANYLNHIASLPAGITSFSCNQNQLDSLPALPPGLVTFNCENNQLTSLPALPITITSMDCSGNQLHFLPALPPSMTVLNCGENQLDSLPVLPVTLTELHCEYDSLTSLPILPAGLTYLDCGSNLLTGLPTLPGTLVDLECYYNQIDSLPALPPSIQIIVCGENHLTALPTLPASLLTLKCYSNQLTTLPTLPGSVIYIDCSINLITSLPALPASLSELHCQENQLPALPGLSSIQILFTDNNLLPSLPTLPGTLNTLSCANNLLPFLPGLPGSLQTLNCSYNPLDSLPALSSLVNLDCSGATLDSLPALPPTLYSLNCSGNSLTSIPSLPASLSSLSCSSNHITNLPTSLALLNFLFCDNNLLTDLPSLPSTLFQLSCVSNAINCFPVFPNSMTYLDIYSNPFTCLPNYIPVMDSVILSYPLCLPGDFVHNPHACDGASGVVGFTYTDIDSSCTKDSTDFQLVNIPVRVYDGSGTLLSQTITAINGVYDFPEPTGTYTVAIDTMNLPIFPQCASPGLDSTVMLTAATPLIQNVNFDFNCKPGFDVGVQSVITSGFVFPGEQHTLKIWAGDMTQWYHMHCAAGLSGQVQVTVNGPVTFNGVTTGALTPTVAGNVYTYSISDFGTINNATAFGLKFTTDTTAGSGYPICVSIVVTPVGGDNDTSNNTTHFCYVVRNSHDPNVKETYPELVPAFYQDWFTYTIHFQNTGTAAAINIHLQDTLDANLDLTTFQVLNYSHANTTTLTGNALSILFPAINLPDSVSSPDSSKAFIQYRIKPKAGLPSGTQIHNTAFIYFDYNAAVVTNTTTNIFRPYTTDVHSIAENNSVNVYPNPATDNITVHFTSASKNVVVEIYDVTGQLVKQIKAENKQSISIADLTNGLYIVKINDSGNVVSKKFMKN